MNANPEIFSLQECSEHRLSQVLAELIKDWFGGGLECPPLAEGAVRKKQRGALSTQSVIDFGCGNGAYCEYLSRYAFENVVGVEGTHAMTFSPPPTPGGFRYNGQKEVQMVQWDLAHPLWLGLKGHVMSIEVAEHLAAEHHDTFMDTLSRHCTGKLVLTWATVGQGGLRHISERTEAQVVPYVERWGFKFQAEESRRWRELVAKELGYFRESIYLFQR